MRKSVIWRVECSAKNFTKTQKPKTNLKVAILLLLSTLLMSWKPGRLPGGRFGRKAVTTAGSRQGTPSSAGLHPARPGQARQQLWLFRPSLGSVFSWQECPALQIRVANVSFCLELAAGRGPCAGTCCGCIGGVVPCSTVSAHRFLTVSWKNLPWLGPVPSYMYSCTYPAACYHLDSWLITM